MRLMIAVLFSASALSAQDITCQPTVPVPKQARTEMKHRPAPASDTVTNVSVPVMLAWPVAANIVTAKQRRANTPVDDREAKAYIITGDIWRVKVEDNDCDFHVEMSAPGKLKTAPRIIVEVPQGSTEARDAVIAMLVNNGYEASGTQDFVEPIRATVTGYAFYDSAHWMKKNPKKGHGHGTKYVSTLWELHPVWKFEEAQ